MLAGPASDFNVFGVKHGQPGYLFEVVLFIERQDFSDTVIFHNDAVNHVPHSGVVLEDTLFHVIEEFGEVIFFIGTNFNEMYS